MYKLGLQKSGRAKTWLAQPLAMAMAVIIARVIEDMHHMQDIP